MLKRHCAAELSSQHIKNIFSFLRQGLAPSGLKLSIPLPPSPEFWDHNHATHACLQNRFSPERTKAHSEFFLRGQKHILSSSSLI